MPRRPVDPRDKLRRYNLYLSQRMIDDLKQAADRRGITASQLVREQVKLTLGEEPKVAIHNLDMEYSDGQLRSRSDGDRHPD